MRDLRKATWCAALGTSILFASPGALAAVLVSVDVTSGTASADVSSAALQANGGEIFINIKNSQGVAWHGVTIELRKKSSSDTGIPRIGDSELRNGTFTSDGGAPQTISGQGQYVHFGPGSGEGDFGPVFTGGAASLSCTLTNCNGAGNTTNVVVVTPSFDSPAGEANMYATFALSSASDLVRNSNPDTWHAVVVGRIVNDDDRFDLVALDATITLPPGVYVTAVTVHQNWTGYPVVPGATVTLQGGAGFSVTGLDVTPGAEFLVVVELSAPIGGDLTKMQLEATFD